MEVPQGLRAENVIIPKPNVFVWHMFSREHVPALHENPLEDTSQDTTSAPSISRLLEWDPVLCILRFPDGVDAACLDTTVRRGFC